MESLDAQLPAFAEASAGKTLRPAEAVPIDAAILRARLLSRAGRFKESAAGWRDVGAREPLLLPLLSLRIELVVALLVSDFDRIDAGLWSRTQSLIARPVRLAHSLGMSLRIVDPGGGVVVDGVVGLVVDCAFAVAIAIVIAVASNPCFHVFIVSLLWSRLATL